MVLRNQLQRYLVEGELRPRAAISKYSFGSRTRSQITAFTTINTPPGYADAPHGKREIQKHPHESQPSIHGCREDIIIPLPPTLSVFKNEVIEYSSNHNPAIEIHTCSRWHCCCWSEKYWKVNQWDPFLAGESFLEQPYHERSQGTY